jgi:putative protease
MKNSNHGAGNASGRNKRKVELLAPAGGMPQLMAAVENGADAVYLGGRFFNARMNAGNFTDEELKEAIDYAHLRNVKVYAAMNVLIRDEELQEAVAHAVELYAMGIDGIILQDLGLADAIGKVLPDLPRHLSTQGTVYNPSGVRAAAKLGFKRVVLARELGLEEIKKIAAEQLCDIEVFVHGALCMCYSGQCHLSRAIGGRSANRGECAQPCRLAYMDQKGDEGYHLSPKDLCAIDQLGSLIEAGVASLKIEGRMKSAEYVATVTRIYRKYLDLALRGKAYQVEAKDMEDLLQAFNRGGFTQGYLMGQPGQKLLSGRIPKHQGVLVGKVTGRPKEKDMVDISHTAALSIGDGIEIHGREIISNILTYIKPAAKGRARIGDFRGDIRPGDLVYRTSSKALTDLAKESYLPEARGQRRTIPVTMKFTAAPYRYPTLELWEGDLHVSATGAELCETARTRSLDEDTVMRQLSKTGGTPFEPASISVEIAEGTSLPLSALNQLRREATDLLIKEKTAGRAAPVFALPRYPQLDDAQQTTVPDDILILPSITKGKEDKWIAVQLGGGNANQPGGGTAGQAPEENTDSDNSLRTASSVMVNNLGWIEEISKNGKKVFAGPGLNIYNGAAAQALRNLGAIPAEASYEASIRNVPLMTTEFPIQSAELVDRKGKRYRVRPNRWHDKWTIEACDPTGKE